MFNIHYGIYLCTYIAFLFYIQYIPKPLSDKHHIIWESDKNNSSRLVCTAEKVDMANWADSSNTEQNIESHRTSSFGVKLRVRGKRI